MSGEITQGRKGVAVVLLALAAVPAGCGQNGPKVYTTTGKIVFKGTGETATQLQGAYVYMEQVEDPKITAVAEIDDDGTFHLGSAIAGRPYQGLPPGTYRARVSPTQVFGKQFISPRYEKFKTSNLEYSVGTQTTQITVEVERVGR